MIFPNSLIFFGFGPIQGKHCRSVANTFINAVKVKAKETSQSAAPVSDEDELKKICRIIRSRNNYLRRI